MNLIEDNDFVMAESASDFASAVVGHRIVSVTMNATRERRDDEPRYWGTTSGTRIELDNGQVVWLHDTSDCCAGTDVLDFLLHAENIDHIITGVRTAGQHTYWHVFADMGDVLRLDVSWSEGSGYYGYGFDLVVEDAPAAPLAAVA